MFQKDKIIEIFSKYDDFSKIFNDDVSKKAITCDSARINATIIITPRYQTPM